MFRRRKPTPVQPVPQQRTPSGWHQEDWQSYDHVAETYERVNAPRFSVPARDLVALAGVEPGHRVLDVGTGTGVAAAAAAEATGGEGLIVGLDPAPKMLGFARAKEAGIRWLVGEALDLPFVDGSFDRVLGNFVVSHFTRYETALFDMFRVLRPGGLLALSNWGAVEDEFGRTWRSVAESLVGKDLYRDAVRRGLPWQEHFSGPDRFADALHRAGLRQVRVEHREYRFEMTQESYLEGQETRMVARSLRRVMGDAIWERFRVQVRDDFRRRFADPIGDTRDVWFGLGRKQ